MKRTSLLFAAFLFLAGTLFSTQVMAQGRIDLGRTQSAQECANVSQDGFTATFSFSSIEAADLSTEKGAFSDITMPGTYPSGNLGEPSLPAAHQLIALPYGAKNVTVEVKNYSTTTYRLADYGIKTIAPQQASVRKDQKPEDIKFAYNEKAYAAKSSRPIAEFELQGNLRGIGVGSLTVNPVNYNPVENTITVYNDIELEVRYNDYDKDAAYNEFARTFSPYFAGIYKTMFNWRDDVYDQHPDLWQAPVKMLVIANRMFEECMQEWIAWKTQKGFYMDVNYTDVIGTTASAIRTFIQNKYAEDAPTFVIIFGDKEQVVASATGSETSKVTDLNYSSIDNDYFPDIFHSRMCAQTVEQMQNIITKTLWYEKDQFLAPNPNTSYLSNVLLIAGWDSSWNPTVAQPTINYATDYYYNAAHGLNDVNVFLQQPYTNCYASLNTGVSFVNYTAHGSETGWYEPGLSVSNCSSFTNEGKPFLAMGNCCLAADWGYSSVCFGEAMIRTNTKGAYAYIGSCPSTYWYEDYYFGVGATNTHGGATPTVEESSTGVYDGTWMDDTYNTVSSIPFLGNLAVCYAHAGSYSTHSSPTYYWQAYHVLGDGSVMPFRVAPTENEVNHLPTMPIGIDLYNVSAAPGSYVAISKDGELHGVGLIGEEGSADITIEPITSGGDVTICVTHPQHAPYFATVPAAAMTGPYVAIDSYAMNVDQANYGETVEMSISVKNVGADASGDLSMTLTTENEYIDILAGEATSTGLEPDEIITVEGFQFNVAENVPDNTKAQFFLDITNGTDTWQGKFTITLHAPDIAVSTIEDDGSQAIFTFINNGSAPFYGGTFNVFSSSVDLTFAETTVTFEDTVDPQATISFNMPYTIDESVAPGTTFEVAYELTSGLQIVDGDFVISFGAILEDFESGNFNNYSWSFDSHPWTIVTTDPHEGTYCAKSTIENMNSSESSMILTVNVLAAGELTFWYKVSSESNYDKLHFYMDNVEMSSWSGTVSWSEYTQAVTTGTHTFKWSYTKDSSVSTGSDCAWVDDIKFPPVNVITFIDPVTDLEATLTGMTVNLTWTGTADADSYIIVRDGETITTVTETTFSELLDEGVYKYTVFAQKDESISKPTSVMVEVMYDAIGDNQETNFKVYPNPTNGMLNIVAGDSDFEYTLFNGMGQEMTSGTAKGIQQVNVSNMAQGVYFLRLTSGAQVSTQKIVIK